MRTKFAAL